MSAESIGSLEPTKIPGYSDAADIQAALRLYHYGSYSYDPLNTDPSQLVNPSIAYTLNSLQDQIDSVGGIPDTILTAKGSLISATAASTPSNLSVGTNGQVLTANSATATGLQWSTPEVTLANTATLTNKTLTSPTVNNPSLTLSSTTSTTLGRLAHASGTSLKLGDGTTTRTISADDVSATLTNKNLSSATNTFPTSLVTLTGTQVLTNKTISGSSNTLSNIDNSSLTNSSITINGTTVSLGGSADIQGESFSPFMLMGG